DPREAREAERQADREGRRGREAGLQLQGLDLATMTTPALTLARPAAADFAELCKPRITATVMLTTLVGFVVASVGAVDLSALGAVLAGAGLVAAGASALNMLLERGPDALMLRTRTRPLPAGRVRPGEALAFGAALTGAGLALLAWRAGATAAGV